MAQYEKRILNQLLDSYEASTLFTGKNKVAVHISFPFNKKTIPAYFDESSLAYEEIHASMERLENQGLIRIEWKKGKEGHIISKVILQMDGLDEAYACVSRTPMAEQIKQNRELLSELRERCHTPICRSLIDHLDRLLEESRSVK